MKSWTALAPAAWEWCTWRPIRCCGGRWRSRSCRRTTTTCASGSSAKPGPRRPCDHHNVVTIYDIGEDDGKPFIAMEFLDGESVAEMVQRRAPLSIDRRLQLLLDLCAGLGYAHRNGIVHRDIKPGNLMVTAEGAAQDSRLRPGANHQRGDEHRIDPRRLRAGNAALHVSGTGRGQGRGRAQRHFFSRRRPLRTADEPEGLSGGVGARRAAQHHPSHADTDSRADAVDPIRSSRRWSTRRSRRIRTSVTRTSGT